MIWFVVAYLFSFLGFPLWVVAACVICGLFHIVAVINRAGKRVMLEQRVEKVETLKDDFTALCSLNKRFAKNITDIITGAKENKNDKDIEN